MCKNSRTSSIQLVPEEPRFRALGFKKKKDFNTPYRQESSKSVSQKFRSDKISFRVLLGDLGSFDSNAESVTRTLRIDQRHNLVS